VINDRYREVDRIMKLILLALCIASAAAAPVASDSKIAFTYYFGARFQSPWEMTPPCSQRAPSTLLAPAALSPVLAEAAPSTVLAPGAYSPVLAEAAPFALLLALAALPPSNPQK